MNFPKDKQVITVNSHPRSGTHLCIDFLRRQYSECQIKKTFNKRLDDLYFPFEVLLSEHQDLEHNKKRALETFRSCSHPIVKFHGYSEPLLTHRFPEWMEFINQGKTIYVYRNLYKVMCSTYIYMQTFENAGKGVNIHEFIRQPFASAANRIQFWVDEIKRFKERENIMMLSYEEILKSPEKVLGKLDSFLGLTSLKKSPMLPPKTNNIWNIRWQRYFSSNPDNTAILASHKGIHNLDPKIVFTEDDVKWIKSIAGDTLTKLNYSLNP